MTMGTARSQPGATRRRPDGPLAEVYRRLVRIHASAAEATDDDPKIRPWVVHELMETLHYIESIGDADGAAPKQTARPT
jgi:hypothetical protein